MEITFYHCTLEADKLFSRFHRSTNGEEFFPHIDHTRVLPIPYIDDLEDEIFELITFT